MNRNQEQFEALLVFVGVICILLGLAICALVGWGFILFIEMMA